MKSWLTQIKREFWEYNTSFLVMQSVVAVMAVIVGIYVVIAYGTPDSKLARTIFSNDDQFGYQYDAVKERGMADNSNKDSDTGTSATANTETSNEYIVDFSKGKLTPIDESNRGSHNNGESFNVTATMFGIHQLFLVITSFVILFYLLSCLYGDRKDRSILFWKSMPVSETRNVTVKFIVAALVVPVVVTLISWLVQICYLMLTMLFVYRIGSDPWSVVWQNADLMGAFFQQLKYVVWLGPWFLPLTAWLLLASALARRSPFLLATIPFVFVILMERLLFGSWSIGLLLLHHLQATGQQLQNIMGDDSSPGATPGRVNLLLNIKEMLAGFILTALLFPATVWLRNHRFEI